LYGPVSNGSAVPPGTCQMIGERYKLYLLALVIYTAAAVVITALDLVAIRYDESVPLAHLITTLSGGFLGGIALVLGILRDNRVEQALKRAEVAEEQVKQERERADRAEAELQRMRAEFDRSVVDRVRRLEELVGMTPPASADDSDATAE
jgi:hypothetical protein